MKRILGSRLLSVLSLCLLVYTCSEHENKAPLDGKIISFSVTDQRLVTHNLLVDDTARTIGNRELLPAYVNLSRLVASFTTNDEKQVTLKLGDETQISGKNTIDFSRDRIYDLYVADENQKSFTVKITKEVLPNNFLTFSFPESRMELYQPAINHETAEITNENPVTFDVDITVLKPVFTTSGENDVVKVGEEVQTSGESIQDFTNPIIYTIEGEDGTSKDFTVKINKSNEGKIISFSVTDQRLVAHNLLVDNVARTISNKELLPAYVNLSRLVASFTTNNEKQVVLKLDGETQTSGANTVDFTLARIYDLYVAGEKQKSFTVKISKELLLNNFLTFSFPENFMMLTQPAINLETGVIANEDDISPKTDITALKPVFTTSEESAVVKVAGAVQTSGASVQDFTQPVVYTIEGEDGTSKDFTVTLRQREEIYYTNPIIKGSYADPTVFHDREKKEFYVYVTASRVRGYRSPDMITWNPIKGVSGSEVVLTKPNFTGESDAAMWAPDINYLDGRYVMYYSLSKWGGGATCGIGVAVCSRAEGPFVPPPGNVTGKLFLSSEIGVNNSIDPCFFEENGKRYLFWGSFNGIYMTELTGDGLAVKDLSQKTKVAGNSFEGTYIHKRGKYYYLFASIGACCEGITSSYKVVVGRATKLSGPYYSKQGVNMTSYNAWNPSNYTPVIMRGDGVNFGGPGHNSGIITDDDGIDWMLYHSYVNNGSDNRNLLLDRIEWDANDWPVLGAGTPSFDKTPGPFFR
jgi:arabinan endo-1,5-alpha-L-arabinosidase